MITEYYFYFCYFIFYTVVFVFSSPNVVFARRLPPRCVLISDCPRKFTTHTHSERLNPPLLYGTMTNTIPQRRTWYHVHTPSTDDRPDAIFLPTRTPNRGRVYRERRRRFRHGWRRAARRRRWKAWSSFFRRCVGGFCHTYWLTRT